MVYRPTFRIVLLSTVLNSTTLKAGITKSRCIYYYSIYTPTSRVVLLPTVLNSTTLKAGIKLGSRDKTHE